jgi:hypothetical protein
MTHICPHCNKPFDGRKNKIFCSRSHSEMYWRNNSIERRASRQASDRKYKAKIRKPKRVLRVKQTPAKPEPHVCTPECTKRFKFCIKKRNEQRRAESTTGTWGAKLTIPSGTISFQR